MAGPWGILVRLKTIAPTRVNICARKMAVNGPNDDPQAGGEFDIAATDTADKQGDHEIEEEPDQPTKKRNIVHAGGNNNEAA